MLLKRYVWSKYSTHLGNPVRFRIMCLLAERQKCITNTVVERLGLAQSAISQHLKVLRESGLIQGEIEGLAACYCLGESGMRWLREQLITWLTEGRWERSASIESEQHAPCC